MFVPKNFFLKYYQSCVKRSKCTYMYPKLRSEILSEYCQTVKKYVLENLVQKYYQSSVKRSKCTYPKTSFRNTIKVMSNGQKVHTQNLRSEILSELCQTVKMYILKNLVQKYYQSRVKRLRCLYPKTSPRNIIREVSNGQNVRIQKLLSEILPE